MGKGAEESIGVNLQRCAGEVQEILDEQRMQYVHAGTTACVHCGGDVALFAREHHELQEAIVDLRRLPRWRECVLGGATAGLSPFSCEALWSAVARPPLWEVGGA